MNAKEIVRYLSLVGKVFTLWDAAHPRIMPFNFLIMVIRVNLIALDLGQRRQIALP